MKNVTGRGRRIRVRETQEHDPTPPGAEPRREAIDILVVDDLEENLLVYRSILEELGENVVTARSGAEALSQVLTHEFAVILLDVNMPDMDGLETAGFIRRRRKSELTPIIFVTAFADELRTARGYAYGAVDFITSPVVPEILRAKVKVFVELFRMRRTIAQHAREQIALADQRVSLVEERSRRLMVEETNRSLQFLANAAAVLGRSLDFDTIVQDIARLPVPFLADRCAVALREGAGEEWRILAARAEGQRVVQESGHGELALPVPLRDPVGRVLATGEAEHEELRSAPLVFPLQVHGNTVGALALWREAAATPFAAREARLAEDLAARCSMALENSWLHMQLQRADRHKSEFLAVLAHELRNPLAPLSSAIHLLEMESLSAPQRGWARQVLDRQMRHMTRLIDDLLDLSRITRNQLELRRETVVLADVVQSAIETCRPLIESRRHALEVALPSEPVLLDADFTRLAQVFQNLLNNAGKYTPEGGHIELDARVADAEVVIALHDDGIGIPSDHLPGVFDMFTQVDRSLEKTQGGLGIGLTIVKRIVEMHGGSVSAASAGPGQGSTFTLRLPRTAPLPRPGPEPALEAAPVRAFRILVADDNRDAAETLGLVLNTMGHEVRLAYDGEDAVAAVMEFRPDVAFLDLGMPRLNGYEACRRIREGRTGETPVLVALTGWGQDADREQTRAAGFDHHLVKPADSRHLLHILKTLDEAAVHDAATNGRSHRA